MFLFDVKLKNLIVIFDCVGEFDEIIDVCMLFEFVEDYIFGVLNVFVFSNEECVFVGMMYC